MRKVLTIFVVVAALAISGVANANVITLQFNANDIFNYATTDNSRQSQQGTARYIWDTPNAGREYRTYNDATRDAGSTPSQDLTSVANILGWTATAGSQGVSHLQLWLNNGRGSDWGEDVVMKRNTSLTLSCGEYDWTCYTGDNSWDGGGYELAHFNTVLGGEGHQNALSPDFNPADGLWSVTGDFYEDVDGDGNYNSAIDNDMVLNNHYTIWFNAASNNHNIVDAYGSNVWDNLDIQGTIIATAVPEPTTICLLGLGALGLFRKKR